MAASSIKIATEQVIAGKYKARADFAAEQGSNQIALRAGDILRLQTQNEDRGWVWAQKSGASGTEEGYVPRNYLEKIPEGDWDQWAYGCEMISCFYAMASGCFILLWGSTTKTDPTVELVIGTFAMMLASIMMIIIFFRNSIQPIYRAVYLGLTAVVLFAGYPMGLWGGITLILAACVELLVWYVNDEVYTPREFSCSRCCRSVFDASVFSMLGFGLWIAANAGIFIWGFEYGEDRADDWNNVENVDSYEIPRGSWGFAQAMAQCILFQVFCLLIFALQGFQQMLLLVANFETARQGKMAQFKQALAQALGRESMLAVHKFISFTMLFCAAFHVLGCFSAYEHSGPNKDFILLFGNAPMITGGLLIILLALTLSSTYLSPERRPRAFRYVHLTSLLYMGVLVLHGKSWFAPNVYKWLIAPAILFAMDKAFRFGIFGFDRADDANVGGTQTTA